MIYCCEIKECGFLFKRYGLVDKCPDCGSPKIRHADKQEQTEYIIRYEVVYPKAKLEQIAKTIKDHEKSPSTVYESVEDMFKDLGIDIEGGGV